MRLTLLIISTVLPVIVGCSGDDVPETYPVTGVVTYQGKPVEGASVSLVAKDPNGRSAGATTDAEGKFSVSTYISSTASPEGAISGEYVITVSKKPVEELPEEMDAQEQMAEFMKRGAPKDLLPKIYQSPDTTTLKVTVVDASPEPLELNLDN